MEPQPLESAAVSAVSPAGDAPAGEPSDVEVGAARRVRVWPAALALYIVAAMAPEMMSGSTPPLRFVQPFNLVFLPILYGTSALLIREVVVRRRLGWVNVLILGAAFGVFQEGLVVQTWFSYMAPGSASHTATDFSVALHVDWSAAIAFTMYHSVISIATPLIIIKRLFPRQASLPWLGRKMVGFLLIWLLLPCAAMAINVAVHLFAAQGYHGPPQPQYALTALAVVALVALGATLRVWPPKPSQRKAPGARRVTLATGAFTLLFFIAILPLAALPMPAVISLAVAVAVYVWGLVTARRWSARRGWGAAQEFALGLGVVAYFTFIMAPIEEFAAHLPLSQGLTLVNLVIFALLALVAWWLARVQRREAARALATAPPVELSVAADEATAADVAR